jgi:hypothetical protein
MKRNNIGKEKALKSRVKINFNDKFNDHIPMKKYLSFLLLSLLGLSGLKMQAQVEKGKCFISGQFNLVGSENTFTGYRIKSISFVLDPSFAYFFKQRLAAGISVNSGVSSTETRYDSHSRTQTVYSSHYGCGVFLRHYKLLQEKLYFISHLELSYLPQTDRIYNSSSDPNFIYTISSPASEVRKYKTYLIKFYPGLGFFLNSKLCLQLFIGDIHYRAYDKKSIYSSTSTKDFGLNLNGSSLFTGVSYHF